jgi:hypothetical protein
MLRMIAQMLNPDVAQETLVIPESSTYLGLTVDARGVILYFLSDLARPDVARRFARIGTNVDLPDDAIHWTPLGVAGISGFAVAIAEIPGTHPFPEGYRDSRRFTSRPGLDRAVEVMNRRDQFNDFRH